MNSKAKYFIVVLGLIISGGLSNVTSAAPYPEKNIEMLAPYGVAANSAIGAKIVVDTASKFLPKPIFVIAAEGAGGTLAGEQVAKRVKPDGYTLLLANSATNGTALFTKKDLRYNNEEFEFLAEYGAFDLALIARADAPFKTLEEFVSYAKTNTVKQASTGVGTSGHLCLELFKLKAGGDVKIDMVPYKTTAELRTSVLGGHTQASFVYGGGGGANDELEKTIKGGGRVLAVTTKKRLDAYPDVPTFSEKGIGLVYSAWYGIAGPKGMPKEATQMLKMALYRSLEDPEVIKNIKALGFRFEFRKAEEFTSYVKEYSELIKMIIDSAQIPKF